MSHELANKTDVPIDIAPSRLAPLPHTEPLINERQPLLSTAHTQTFFGRNGKAIGDLAGLSGKLLLTIGGGVSLASADKTTGISTELLIAGLSTLGIGLCLLISGACCYIRHQNSYGH